MVEQSDSRHWMLLLNKKPFPDSTGGQGIRSNSQARPNPQGQANPGQTNNPTQAKQTGNPTPTTGTLNPTGNVGQPTSQPKPLGAGTQGNVGSSVGTNTQNQNPQNRTGAQPTSTGGFNNTSKLMGTNTQTGQTGQTGQGGQGGANQPTATQLRIQQQQSALNNTANTVGNQLGRGLNATANTVNNTVNQQSNQNQNLNNKPANTPTAPTNSANNTQPKQTSYTSPANTMQPRNTSYVASCISSLLFQFSLSSLFHLFPSAPPCFRSFCVSFLGVLIAGPTILRVQLCNPIPTLARPLVA